MRVCFLENQVVLNSQILTWLAVRKDVDQIFYTKNEVDLLDYIEHEPLDVAIVRLSENKTYGFMLGEKIKESKENIRLIFISDDRVEAIKAYDAGASGYLMDSDDQQRFNNCLNNIAIKSKKQF